MVTVAASKLKEKPRNQMADWKVCCKFEFKINCVRLKATQAGYKVA